MGHWGNGQGAKLMFGLGRAKRVTLARMTIDSVKNTEQTGISWNCNCKHPYILENIRLGHYYECYLDIHNMCYGVLGLEVNEKS